MYFSPSTNTCSSKMEDKYLCVRGFLAQVCGCTLLALLPTCSLPSIGLTASSSLGPSSRNFGSTMGTGFSFQSMLHYSHHKSSLSPIIVWICHKICFGGVKVLSAQLMEISHQSQRFQIKVQLWSSSFPPFNPYAMRTNFWCFSLQGWLVWNIGTASPEASEGVQSHQVMPPLFFFFFYVLFNIQWKQLKMLMLILLQSWLPQTNFSGGRSWISESLSRASLAMMIIVL